MTNYLCLDDCEKISDEKCRKSIYNLLDRCDISIIYTEDCWYVEKGHIPKTHMKKFKDFMQKEYGVPYLLAKYGDDNYDEAIKRMFARHTNRRF